MWTSLLLLSLGKEHTRHPYVVHIMRTLGIEPPRSFQGRQGALASVSDLGPG